MPEPESREPRIASAPLAGSAALVTGGAKRIGRAIALRLAASGANVAITYRNSQPEAEETVRALAALGVERLRPPHRPHRRREHPPIRRSRHRRVRPARSAGQQRRPLRAGRARRHHPRAVGPDLRHQHARSISHGAGGLSSSPRRPRPRRTLSTSARWAALTPGPRTPTTAPPRRRCTCSRRPWPRPGLRRSASTALCRE